MPGRKPKKNIPAPTVASLPALPVPDEIEEYEHRSSDGKVLSLTHQQKQLLAGVLLTNMSVSEAAAAAGYASPASASNFLRQTHIRELVNRMVGERLELLGVKAVRTLDNLLSARSEKVRLDAVNSVLDRLGHGADKRTPPSVGVSITFNLGEADPKPDIIVSQKP